MLCLTRICLHLPFRVGRSRSFWLLSVFLAFVALGPTASAASMYDLEGVWTGGYQVKVGLLNLRSAKSNGTIYCSFVATDVQAGSYACEVNAIPFLDGTLSLNKAGTKVNWNISASALQSAQAALISWLSGAVAALGILIDESSVRVEVTSLKTVPMTVSKRGKLGKGTVTVGGKISAIVNGLPVIKRFSYQATISLNTHVPG